MNMNNNFFVLILALLVLGCQNNANNLFEQWEILGEPDFTTSAENAEIKLYNGIPYVAYLGGLRPGSTKDNATDSDYFHVQKFQNGEWQYLTDKDLPGYTSMNMDPSIEIDNTGNVYISYSAREPSPNEGQNFISPLKVYKYNGTNWSQVGDVLHQEGFGSDLAISSNNELFCSYIDAVYEGAPWDETYLYTKKWNGTNWEEIGKRTKTIDDYALTEIDSEGVLYSVYKDNGDIGVHWNKWNSWKSIAKTNIEGGGEGISMYKNIVIDSDDTVYTTAQFVLGTGEGRENRVYKLEKGSNNWEQVGDSVKYSFNYVSLAMNSNNELYMAYIEVDPIAYVFHENHDQYNEETSVDSRFTVRKLVNGNWLPVGKRGFTSRRITRPKIVVDNENIYVMFRNSDANSEDYKKYSVMVFNIS